MVIRISTVFHQAFPHLHLYYPTNRVPR